jgi:hypothetical protein
MPLPIRFILAAWETKKLRPAERANKRTLLRRLFDAADSTAPVDKRTVSSMTPQAFFLPDNPFVLAQTQALAKRILVAGKDDERRINPVYDLL